VKRAVAISLIIFLTYLSLQSQMYSIGHRTVQPYDSSRNRTITDTEIYYPANTAGDNVAVANGQFPLLVFGHGFTIRWDAYDYIWSYFVPKGYICIFPRTEGNLSPNHGNFGGDLKFLAQWIQQENSNSSSPFFGKVLNKAAVMGHSMGGGCTYLAANGNNVFTTIVSLAAANTNPSAITAAQSVSCPVLSIAGAEDCVTKPNEHQKPIFDSLTSSIKYYTELTGASHCNFTSSGASTCFSAEGISCLGYGPFISRAEQNSRTLHLAEPWLEFWLKDKCNAWQRFLDTLQTYISNQYLSANQQNGNPTMPSAAVPTITLVGNALQSSPASSYQWYWNGNPIPGATQQTYIPTQSGNYTVKITDSNGCTATAAPFNYTSTSSFSNFQNQIFIFPNPTQGNLIHFHSDVNLNNFNYEIMDASGKILQNGKLQNSTIDLTGINNGLYIIRLYEKNFSFISKLIKN
jgi:hypothetical protein